MYEKAGDAVFCANLEQCAERAVAKDGNIIKFGDAVRRFQGDGVGVDMGMRVKNHGFTFRFAWYFTRLL